MRRQAVEQVEASPGPVEDIAAKDHWRHPPPGPQQGAAAGRSGRDPAHCRPGRPGSTEGWTGERDVTRLPPNRRNIGLVLQFHALFAHMTVRENLAPGRHRKDEPGKPLEERVHAAQEWRWSAMRRAVSPASGGTAAGPARPAPPP